MRIIVGIAGSSRQHSYNSALLQAASQLAPPEVKVETASIAEIPLYDADVEKAQGVPASVRAIKERIVEADGLLLATPEYNNSIPGVFKNAIDWLSRPPSDRRRVFGDKPVGLMGATPGRGGTRLAQAAWLPILRTLGAQHWSGKQLYVAGASQVFDEEGLLVDDGVRTQLSDYMRAFSEFLGA